MIATMILVPLYLTAQVFHEAVNPENFTNAPSINNVTNTGADMLIEDAQYSRVMVFDGDDPQFAWETNNGSGSDYFFIDGIWDPDVVLTDDFLYALVCLEELSSNSIYLSLWEYNQAGVFSEVIGQLGAYNFPHYIDEGKNPNIDIGYDDKFVITWESLGQPSEIFAIAGEYLGGAIDLSPDIAYIAPEAHRSPDISILGDYVSFTFVRDDGNGAESWVVMQADYPDVYSPPQGLLVTPIFQQVVHFHSGTNESVYGRPRIASPPTYPGVPANDFVAVIDFYWEDWDVGIWEILFVNYHNGLVYGAPTVFNDNYILFPNYEPVVTYTGDLGVVCWTSYIEYPSTGYSSLDVVGQYFQTLGNPGQAYNPLDFHLVNLHYAEIQRTPAVGGRRWLDGYGLIFWVDEDSNDMAYRVNQEGTNNMRKGPEEETEALPPGFTVLITNGTIRVITELKNYNYQLMDVTGRVVLHKTASHETSVSLEGFSPGIYFIKCYAPNAVETRKFLIH